jgi:carboxymethylenebutenolidase
MTLIALFAMLQDVKFKSGDEEISAYVARPKGDGPHPGVVVIQEWWGLNDQIRGVGDRLAKEGLLALCVDLYRGKVAKDRDEAHELMRGLPEDRAIRDLLAAVAYLKEQKCPKIGSVGFCMGGSYSLSLALETPDLAASAIFYGRLLTDREKLGKLSAAVIGFFGDQDRGIPVESVRKFEGALKELNKNVTVHIYEGAGHAFANETGKQYHKESAEDAWKKLVDHLNQHLK